MAKRINLAKPLFLYPESVNIFEEKFKENISMNFFSNQYVYISKNCKNQSLPYHLGELNGVFVNDWNEESQLTNVFIISIDDYQKLQRGFASKEVIFIEKLLNKSQSLIDERKFKLSRNLHIITEETFEKYFNDRQNFINNNTGIRHNPFRLYDLLSCDFCHISEKPKIEFNSAEFIRKNNLQNVEFLGEEPRMSQEELIGYKLKKIPNEWFQPKLDFSEENLFTGKKVVITGDFSFSRPILAERLWNSGADLDATIGKGTDFVIMGENAGWKKLEQIKDLNIRCISEKEILEIFDLS